MLQVCPTCHGSGNIEATPVVAVSAPPKPIEKDKVEVPLPTQPKGHNNSLSHLRRF